MSPVHIALLSLSPLTLSTFIGAFLRPFDSVAFASVLFSFPISHLNNRGRLQRFLYPFFFALQHMYGRLSGERFNPADPWDVDTLYIFSLCETMAGRPPPCLRARQSGHRWIDFLPYNAATAEWKGSGRKGRRSSLARPTLRSMSSVNGDEPASPKRNRRRTVKTL